MIQYFNKNHVEMAAPILWLLVLSWRACLSLPRLAEWSARDNFAIPLSISPSTDKFVIPKILYLLLSSKSKWQQNQTSRRKCKQFTQYVEALIQLVYHVFLTAFTNRQLESNYSSIWNQALHYWILQTNCDYQLAQFIEQRFTEQQICMVRTSLNWLWNRWFSFLLQDIWVYTVHNMHIIHLAMLLHGFSF